MHFKHLVMDPSRSECVGFQNQLRSIDSILDALKTFSDGSFAFRMCWISKSAEIHRLYSRCIANSTQNISEYPQQLSPELVSSYTVCGAQCILSHGPTSP